MEEHNGIIYKQDECWNWKIAMGVWGGGWSAIEGESSFTVLNEIETISLNVLLVYSYLL